MSADISRLSADISMLFVDISLMSAPQAQMHWGKRGGGGFEVWVYVITHYVPKTIAGGES